MRRTEFGAVAAKHLYPLRAGVLDGLGDEVGDVALAAAVIPTYAEAAPVCSPPRT
jgi:hypothetical protein